MIVMMYICWCMSWKKLNKQYWLCFFVQSTRQQRPNEFKPKQPRGLKVGLASERPDPCSPVALMQFLMAELFPKLTTTAKELNYLVSFISETLIVLISFMSFNISWKCPNVNITLQFPKNMSRFRGRAYNFYLLPLLGDSSLKNFLQIFPCLLRTITRLNQNQHLLLSSTSNLLELRLD